MCASTVLGYLLFSSRFSDETPVGFLFVFKLRKLSIAIFSTSLKRVKTAFDAKSLAVKYHTWNSG